MVIRRTTMFKLPEKQDQENLIKQYDILKKDAQKDGKPYVLSLHYGPAIEDQRSQGWTFVAQSTFENLQDMKYYDDECAAHKQLKQFVMGEGKVQGAMTVYYEDRS